MFIVKMRYLLYVYKASYKIAYIETAIAYLLHTFIVINDGKQNFHFTLPYSSFAYILTGQ